MRHPDLDPNTAFRQNRGSGAMHPTPPCSLIKGSPFLLFQGLGSFGNRVVFAKPTSGTDALVTIAKDLR
jgi:hypothetical protein